MSAFMCSDLHISMLAHYASDHNTGPDPTRNAHEIGEVLHAANEASVNHRYQQSTCHEFALAPYEQCITRRTRHNTDDWDHVQVFKLAQSYAYQACEPDSWKGSTAHQIVTAIEAAAIANEWRTQIVESPAYDRAKWSL